MLRSIELCAGAGGLSLGLEEAGFTPIALIDNDRHACATLRLNRPRWNVIEADLHRLDLSSWKGIDLLSGGLPCPPYSVAGLQRGSDDERDLFPRMLEIVEEVHPRAILMENVRGLMSPKFKSLRQQLSHDLEQRGFRPYWVMLNAADYATPQNRYRVFLIGLRNDVSGELAWPFPIHKKQMTVGAAIGDLMSQGGWKRVASWIKGANRIAPTIVGGSKKHGGPDLGPTRARRSWAELGVDGRGIADQAPGPDFEGMPRLTPTMIARLQGFSDCWRFFGGKTQQCRQIGNALPPPLAAAVAGSVAACLR